MNTLISSSSKNRNQQMRYWLLILSAFSLVTFSCNEISPIGSEILPNGDGAGNFFNDSTTIISSTVREDSLRTDKLFINQLGYMNDPIFGKSKSSVLMGFRTPNVTVSQAILDTNGGYQLDSIVLSLKINTVYGDTNKPMNFKVYKQVAPLSNEIIHYSNINFEQGMLEVGSIENYIPDLSNEFAEDTTFTELGAQLRIRLNPFFGQSIINILGTEQLTSDDLFHQVLPGLVVVPQDQDGSMIAINMQQVGTGNLRENALQSSRLHLYYKNALSDTLNIMFPVNPLNLGISQFTHDFDATNVESALDNMSLEGDEVSYIQGLAGVKTKIQFPYLESYGNIAVQKAEIVVTRLIDGFEDIYLPPDRLFVLKVDSGGVSGNTTDFSNFNDAHNGGFSNEVTLENGETALQYRINVSNQMQRFISGEDANDGLFLNLYSAQNDDFIVINASDILPDRIVIGGGNNAVDEYRLKLEMTYSILE